jgi:hypothetical protein
LQQQIGKNGPNYHVKNRTIKSHLHVVVKEQAEKLSETWSTILNQPNKTVSEHCPIKDELLKSVCEVTQYAKLEFRKSPRNYDLRKSEAVEHYHITSRVIIHQNSTIAASETICRRVRQQMCVSAVAMRPRELLSSGSSVLLCTSELWGVRVLTTPFLSQSQFKEIG